MKKLRLKKVSESPKATQVMFETIIKVSAFDHHTKAPRPP